MSTGPLWLFVNSRMWEGLTTFLDQARSDGKSYREISDEIESRTGIKVGKSSVERWVNRKT